jgi:hypothetical protein
VSHLQCPECRLTVPAAAYYLRGDQCPRCMTAMEPYTRPRPGTAPAPFSGRKPLPGGRDGAQEGSEQQAV